LAWHYVVGEEVPFTEAVNLVDAYDLWDKNRPGCLWEDVVKYHLGTEEQRASLDFWGNAAAQLFVPKEIMDLGTERFNELREIAKDREEASHIEQIQDVRFALFKAPVKWHSLVHDLVKESTGVDMTVSYAIDVKTKKLVFNVRSNVNSKISALRLAKSLGGGGHPQAAGFNQPKHVDPLITLTTALKDLQK
jgi:oligoribonuclease NrnB/cAMP/cGMP phosphodiesterase (DHH superfamily)